MVKRCCVSISDEEFKFLELYNLSPTNLLKVSIHREMELISELSAKSIKELNQKIARLALTLRKYTDFIQSKGLTDEFIDFEQNVVQQKAN